MLNLATLLRASFRTLCFIAIVQFAVAATPRSVLSAEESLVGAWKVAEVVTTGAGAGLNTSPQPGLLFLTKSHYSLTRIMSDKERPKFAAPKNDAALTDSEKIARYDQWAPFQAQAGTYEVKGTTFTTHPLVAKNQDVVGSTGTAEMKRDGAALWLIYKSAAGAPPSEMRVKYVRVD